MNFDELRARYESRRGTFLEPLARGIKRHIESLVSTYPRVDSVRARAKTTASFLDKARQIEDDKPKYTDPINQIQDQLAARIIVRYLSDVEAVCEIVRKYLPSIEAKSIEPDRPSEFGYEGKHFILLLPSEVIDEKWGRDSYPPFFELQVKTLFQHAWGEADHDLAYKSPTALTLEQRRRVAFTAAQAWGADQVFQQLFRELRQPLDEAASPN